MSRADYSQISVIKRNGEKHKFDSRKITSRIKKLTQMAPQLDVNYAVVTQKITPDVTDGMHTFQIDELAARVASGFAAVHPDYLTLAARIAISNHNKNTAQYGDSFSGAMTACYTNRRPNGTAYPRLNDKFYKFVHFHKKALNAMVDYDRDNRFDYFGFSTLIDRYLIKRSGDRKAIAERPQDYVIERPQDMWMRVACALCMNRVEIGDTSVLPRIKQVYDSLSLGYYTFATPVLFNAGTHREQFISCFLATGNDDLDGEGGILDTIKKLGTISKYAGGIGWQWPLRHAGSEVKSTNGTSSGMEPFIVLAQAVAVAVDQGGKRKGAFAHYLSPIHPYFMEWLKLRRDGGAAPHLFYGAWIPDYFMRAVKEDEKWYYFDPCECPEIYGVYGKEAEVIRNRLIEQKRYYGEPVSAQAVWREIYETECETSMPYICFSDAANTKSNMQSIGPINSSNLCTEIYEPHTSNEYACCVVASICLPRFLTVTYDCKHNPDEGERHDASCGRKCSYDFKGLAAAAAEMVDNLNSVIDINFYPVKEAERGNTKYRPLSIGVQGLADVFARMRISFTSDAARTLNRRIFETLSFGAIRRSCELAKRDGPHHGFADTPIARGIYQWNMWNVDEKSLSGMWDWDGLRAEIKTNGMRNALLIGLPPTASTSQIQGNNECFEPYTDMLYVRKTLSGEFPIVNKHMVEHLLELGLWDYDMIRAIIADRGSVQKIAALTPELKSLYRTAWELDMKTLAVMNTERNAFVCQGASTNHYFEKLTYTKWTSLMFYMWSSGNKTGGYYAHQRDDATSAQFTESADDRAAARGEERKKMAEAVPEGVTKILSNGKAVVCGDSCSG